MRGTQFRCGVYDVHVGHSSRLSFLSSQGFAMSTFCHHRTNGPHLFGFRLRNGARGFFSNQNGARLRFFSFIDWVVRNGACGAVEEILSRIY
jgi:hypothetical protein